ncbi:hypothetical protein EKK58_05135 [Candidatus Dependentiae bacterium]|nr:MAG: hypothetical protein EKK58_05135 [Candidatus Dependentiae bacterium]
MYIKQKLITALGLICISHATYSITPQAYNKIKQYEAELEKKYKIIDELNNATKKQSADRIRFTKDGYNLGIESIHKLKDEISNAIKEIQKLDKALADSKIPEQEKQFKIINNWVLEGKVGTEKSITLGDSKKEFIGISELQNPISKAIDKLKTLTTSDIGYKSEVDLLSSALNRYMKELATYDDAINAQYPKLGFETKGIFLGKHPSEGLVFSKLNKQIFEVAEKLANATDGSKNKLIDQTSKWYESKTVGEYIQEQITTLKTDRTKEMHGAIAKIAKESAESRTLTPDSPWVYAEKKFFVPFLKEIKDDVNKELDEKVGGSFAYISKNKDEVASLKDMVLILDADESITAYVKTDARFLNTEANKKTLQDFASTYARITVEALLYATKLAVGDKAKDTDTNKDFYNNTILANANKLKEAFVTFYNAHKNALDLEKVTIAFDNNIPSLKDLKNLKDTFDMIQKSTPSQLE